MGVKVNALGVVVDPHISWSPKEVRVIRRKIHRLHQNIAYHRKRVIDDDVKLVALRLRIACHRHRAIDYDVRIVALRHKLARGRYE